MVLRQIIFPALQNGQRFYLIKMSQPELLLKKYLSDFHQIDFSFCFYAF
jgi:hypothetical protein